MVRLQFAGQLRRAMGHGERLAAGGEFPDGRVRQMGKREEQGPHGVDEGAFERLAAVQAVAPVGEKQNFDSGPRAPAPQHGPQGVAGFDAPRAMAATGGSELDRARRQTGRADMEFSAMTNRREPFTEQQALPVGIRVHDRPGGIDPAVVAQAERRRRQAFQGLGERCAIALAAVAALVQHGDPGARGGRRHIAKLGRSGGRHEGRSRHQPKSTKRRNRAA